MPCPDPCNDLLQQILNFIAVLQKRYWDLRNNVGNLPQIRPAQPDPRYGFRSIDGERQQFQNWQKGLQNRLSDWNSQNCGPPPADAWGWATRETPTADPKPADQSSNPMSMADTAAKTGAAIGAGYIAYRIIRMLPSLLPPLWETIPANLAIP